MTQIIAPRVFTSVPASQLRAKCVEAIEQSYRVEVDLSQVTECDPGSVQFLLSMKCLAMSTNKDFHIVRPTPAILAELAQFEVDTNLQPIN